MKILIVDDSQVVRSDIKRAFRNDPHEFIEAQTTAEAKQCIAASRPDLILLDIVMSGEDGIVFLRQIRTCTDTCDLPVIVISSLASDAQRKACLEEGATDHIGKPFSHAQLRQSVALALATEPAPSSWEGIRKRLIQTLNSEHEDTLHDHRRAAGGRVVTFLGVKGGAGTTTTAVNVASVWTSEGKSVVLAEMTPGFSSVSFQLDCKPVKPSAQLSDDSIVRCVERRLHSTSFGMKLVTATPWQDAPSSAAFDNANILAHISTLGELVAVDLRFDATAQVRQVLELTDVLVLVVERDEFAVHVLREAWRVMEQWNLKCRVGVAAVVIKTAVPYNIETFKSQLPCQLWGTILTAQTELAWSVQQRVPLVLLRPDEAVSQTYLKLAELLLAPVHAPVLVQR